MNYDVDILERWLLIAKGKRLGKKLTIVVHPSQRNTWVVSVQK